MCAMNYSQKLNDLKNRRQDIEILKKSYFADAIQRTVTENYESLREAESIKYAIGAMSPVDQIYTKNTYEEGERVKNQLEKLKEKVSIEFKYQGSVTNNTHIKAYSDIDILTIHGAFYTLEPPLISTNPYHGDPIQDLLDLRGRCYNILYNAYPTANVDNNGAKSISLSGGSLKRKIDIVPANWYNTVKYEATRIDYYRGINILDYYSKKLLENQPFYHNKLLEDKDNATFKNYKRVVRFLKTLRFDASQKIDLSSYDIAAIMYNMDNGLYLIGNSPLMLIENSLRFLIFIRENELYRNSLKVPDGSRSIFCTNGANTTNLNLLIKELSGLYQDILIDLVQSGMSINKQILVA